MVISKLYYYIFEILKKDVTKSLHKLWIDLKIPYFNSDVIGHKWSYYKKT